jgi:uncharacterized protein YqgV (UPF0045/DUF77 family)
MKIMAELSYYPLAKYEYPDIINNVVAEFSNFDLEISYTSVSTIVIGDHSDIIQLIEHIITNYFMIHKSILEVKFSNACFSKENGKC